MPGKERSPEFDEDNPEWTETDFARARPAHELLPRETLAAFPRTRGAQKSLTKVPVSIRLSPDVLDYFKSTGPGWQTRIDDVLRQAVRAGAKPR